MMKQIYQCLGRVIELTPLCFYCVRNRDEEPRCREYVEHKIIYDEEKILQDARRAMEKPVMK